MGDYSAICAVTGLPITGSQKIVGFNLTRYRWHNSSGARNMWVPNSWPVIGEYDYSGGIEEENLDSNCALIHYDVWNNAHIYWHKENRPYTKDWLNPEKALEQAKRDKDFKEKYPDIVPKETWKDTDYLYHYLKDQLQKTCFGLVFREMVDTKENVQGGDPDKESFLGRSPFMEIVLEKILAGQWKKIEPTLAKLICLYSGQMITGRYIGPCQEPHVEQYPKYEQRIKTLEFSLALAKKLASAR